MAQVVCDYCGGYGSLPASKAGTYNTCPKCHGLGKMQGRDPAKPPPRDPRPPRGGKTRPQGDGGIRLLVFMVVAGLVYTQWVTPDPDDPIAAWTIPVIAGLIAAAFWKILVYGLVAMALLYVFVVQA